MDPVGIVIVFFYVLLLLGGAATVVAAPVYIVVELVRFVRGLRPRVEERRGRAAEELREQYAAGYLSLVGLEERLETALTTESHFELDHVLHDLPPRPPRLQRVAVFDLVAGVAVLLVLHGLAARGAGALLALGALAPPLRWRALAIAFLAGLVLLAAPVAAVPLGVSAGWRFATRS